MGGGNDSVTIEDLAPWQAHADAQLAEMGGAPNYLYDYRRVFDPDQVAHILTLAQGLAFGPGEMKGDGVNIGRRHAECASLNDAGTLARMDLMRPAPQFKRLPYAIWNRYPTGGYITWHQDTEPGDPRTFTIIALLKEADEGGEFQLNGYGTIHLLPGEAILFPAHVFHRVSPVLAGTRESLTLWVSRTS